MIKNLNEHSLKVHKNILRGSVKDKHAPNGSTWHENVINRISYGSRHIIK